MIRALVVDDSSFARRTIVEALFASGDIEVVATAANAEAAMAAIRTHRPDVATFDVEMPGTDGITLLEQLMHSDPLPVVMVSSTTTHGSVAAMRAFEAGAVEVLAKPAAAELPQFREALVRAVRAAASSRVGRIVARAPLTRAPPSSLTPTSVSTGAPQLLAIGASTGGTEALAYILARLPEQSPPLVVVQHLPAAFCASFAKRLDSLSALEVAVALDGQELRPGCAYIAPGGRHLMVARRGLRLHAALDDGPPEHYQRPSADVLFRSVAQAVGRQAVGALLTGMGSDGARGLLAMRESGAATLAQDEESCVVYGMPRAAVELGAAALVCPLLHMPERLLGAAPRPERTPRVAHPQLGRYTQGTERESDRR